MSLIFGLEISWNPRTSCNFNSNNCILKSTTTYWSSLFKVIRISLFMFIFISDLSLLALWILPRWRSPPSTLISTFQHLFLDFFFFFFFGQKYKCIEGDSSLNLGSMKLLKRWINRWSANMTAHWQYPSLECNSKALDGLHSISINVSVKLSILTLI